MNPHQAGSGGTTSLSRQALDHSARLAAVADLSPDEQRRVLMTAGCADCRSIPKVPHAGETFADATGRYQRMHNGVRIIEDCYCGRWMTTLIRLLEGHHEPQEERAYYELLKHIEPGATMIELGSWWAYYSLWFAARIPDARLHLIEPDPRNLAVGEANFAANAATGHFHQYRIGRHSHAARQFRCDDGQEFLVPGICVDDFLASHNIERVDLLLADIQGAEGDMLLGAEASLAAGKIRFLVVSTHHHSLSGNPLTHQQCLRLLRERGAHILAEHTVAESFSGDGLIVAAMDPADRDLPPIELSYNRACSSLFRELEYDLADAWAAKPLPSPVRGPWYKRVLRR